MTDAVQAALGRLMLVFSPLDKGRMRALNDAAAALCRADLALVAVAAQEAGLAPDADDNGRTSPRPRAMRERQKKGSLKKCPVCGRRNQTKGRWHLDRRPMTPEERAARSRDWKGRIWCRGGLEAPRVGTTGVDVDALAASYGREIAEEDARSAVPRAGTTQSKAFPCGHTWPAAYTECPSCE